MSDTDITAELADALERVLDNSQPCRFVRLFPWEGRCDSHTWEAQDPYECSYQAAREVLRKARGAS